MSGAGVSNLEKQLADASAWPHPDVTATRDQEGKEGGDESRDDALSPRLPANLIFEEEKVLGTTATEELVGASENLKEVKKDEEMEDVEEGPREVEDHAFDEAMREEGEGEGEREDPMAIDDAPAAAEPEAESQEPDDAHDELHTAEPPTAPLADPLPAEEDEPTPAPAPLDEAKVDQAPEGSPYVAAEVVDELLTSLPPDQDAKDLSPPAADESEPAVAIESSAMDHDGADEEALDSTPEEALTEKAVEVTSPDDATNGGDEADEDDQAEVAEDHMDIGEMSGFEASSLHEGEVAILSISAEGIIALPPAEAASHVEMTEEEAGEVAQGGQAVDREEEEDGEKEEDDEESELNDMMVNGVRVLGQKYQVECVVGEGAYGMVMRCRKIDDLSIVVAIKAFKIEDSDPDAEDVKRTARREVSILRKLQHK